jgi:hypothetical protein
LLSVICERLIRVLSTAPSSTNGFDNFEAATQSMPCGNRTGRQIHLLAPKRNGIAGGK